MSFTAHFVCNTNNKISLLHTGYCVTRIISSGSGRHLWVTYTRETRVGRSVFGTVLSLLCSRNINPCSILELRGGLLILEPPERTLNIFAHCALTGLNFLRPVKCFRTIFFFCVNNFWNRLFGRVPRYYHYPPVPSVQTISLRLLSFV